jgi:hypothetical protein
MTPAPKARVVVGFSPCRSDLCRHHIALLGSARGWPEGLVLGGLGLEDGLEVAVVFPDGPGDASELVRDGGGGLVVSDFTFEAQRPGAEAVAVLHALGVVEDRARAMDEEQAQVGVAALGDPAEASAQSA